MNKINRRDLVRKTSALAIWTAPALTAVTLPVHAQTSCTTLVDVPQPSLPGGIPCVSITQGWREYNFYLRNDSCESIVITGARASDSKSVANWSIDSSVALPHELAPSEFIRIPLLADRLYTCLDNGSLSIDLNLSTSVGAMTFSGGRSSMFL